MKKESEDLIGRRSVIKTTGTAIGALTSVSTTAAATSDKEEADAAVGGSEISLGGDNAMSPREMVEYARRLADDHEDVSAEDIAPHASSEVTATGQTPDLNGISTVGAWNENYSMTTSLGVKFADVENAVTLYRSNEPDDSGRWYYFVWVWSKATPADRPGGKWGYTYFRSDFGSRDGAYHEKFSPSTRQDRHEKPISVGLTVGIPSGAQFGINGSTVITEGYIAPDDVTQGKNGATGFKFRASGDKCKETNALNGAIHITSDVKYETYSDIPSGAFYWTVKGETEGI